MKIGLLAHSHCRIFLSHTFEDGVAVGWNRWERRVGVCGTLIRAAVRSLQFG